MKIKKGCNSWGRTWWISSGYATRKKGYDVTIYEKQGYVGGRTSEIKLGDYKFDMGPTFLNMLYIAEEIFELTGRNIRGYIE